VNAIKPPRGHFGGLPTARPSGLAERYKPTRIADATLTNMTEAVTEPDCEFLAKDDR
jgi:hypothetical protein